MMVFFITLSTDPSKGPVQYMQNALVAVGASSLAVLAAGAGGTLTLHGRCCAIATK